MSHRGRGEVRDDRVQQGAYARHDAGPRPKYSRQGHTGPVGVAFASSSRTRTRRRVNGRRARTCRPYEPEQARSKPVGRPRLSACFLFLSFFFCRLPIDATNRSPPLAPLLFALVLEHRVSLGSPGRRRRGERPAHAEGRTDRIPTQPTDPRARRPLPFPDATPPLYFSVSFGRRRSSILYKSLLLGGGWFAPFLFLPLMPLLARPPNKRWVN